LLVRRAQTRELRRRLGAAGEHRALGVFARGVRGAARLVRLGAPGRRERRRLGAHALGLVGGAARGVTLELERACRRARRVQLELRGVELGGGHLRRSLSLRARARALLLPRREHGVALARRVGGRGGEVVGAAGLRLRQVLSAARLGVLEPRLQRLAVARAARLRLRELLRAARLGVREVGFVRLAVGEAARLSLGEFPRASRLGVRELGGVSRLGVVELGDTPLLGFGELRLGRGASLLESRLQLGEVRASSPLRLLAGRLGRRALLLQVRLDFRQVRAALRLGGGEFPLEGGSLARASRLGGGQIRLQPLRPPRPPLAFGVEPRGRLLRGPSRGRLGGRHETFALRLGGFQLLRPHHAPHGVAKRARRLRAPPLLLALPLGDAQARLQLGALVVPQLELPVRPLPLELAVALRARRRAPGALGQRQALARPHRLAPRHLLLRLGARALDVRGALRALAREQVFALSLHRGRGSLQLGASSDGVIALGDERLLFVFQNARACHEVRLGIRRLLGGAPRHLLRDVAKRVALALEAATQAPQLSLERLRVCRCAFRVLARASPPERVRARRALRRSRLGAGERERPRLRGGRVERGRRGFVLRRRPDRDRARVRRFRNAGSLGPVARAEWDAALLRRRRQRAQSLAPGGFGVGRGRVPP
jgi:hypothetical protein